jgi:long-chain acyl-CoA synthetase
MEIRDFRNVHEMVKETVDRCSERVGFKSILDSGEMEAVTWADFYQQLRQAAKSLIALGIGKDDKVNILSYTCYRWVLTDMALMSIGSCTVGIYQSNLPKDCQYIIEHSESVLVFAEDLHQLGKLLEIRDEIPNVRKVILFKGEHKDDWVLTYEEFLELGKEVSDEALEERIADVTSSELAAIVYTSGTTGLPKGAVLTHDNITFTAQSVLASAQIRDGDEALLFLPLAHIYARTCVGVSMIAGNTTTFARGLETLSEDFKIARPHWFPSVPRVYEKVHTKIISGAESKGGLALKIFRWACRVGRKVSDYKLEKRSIPALTALQYKIATKLVFTKVHAALGSRVRWCISGAAPLNPDIGRFFHAAGVLILEGIGMTENTSFTNVNRYDNYRFGWVGPTGPGIEQKVADDGEGMYRGRNVMKEYFKMPEETAETLTEDGWQHTGDLGEIDDAGFLRITGRKKDLIVTAGGKNIAPSAIEGSLATSKYINQACVIGDRRKHLTALITVDSDNLKEYAEANDISFQSLEELVKDERVIALLGDEVEQKNQSFATFETIKRFRVVDEFTIENSLLTPTMKVKRNMVMEKYTDLIEEMYPEG